MEEVKAVREIKCDDGSVVVVIRDGEFDAVYRRRTDNKFLHYRGEAGSPGDSSEFFKLPKGMTDEYIIMTVQIYESGHAQGWRDGQWQLRQDFRDLMRIKEK